MHRDLEELFSHLSHSNFRSSFHLSKSMKDYVRKKGLDVIESHAYDFINKKLKPAFPFNDGKQTAYRGHPVFIAQHATATCCRGCLFKWHYIAKGRELTLDEVNYLVKVIMFWIRKEMNM